MKFAKILSVALYAGLQFLSFDNFHDHNRNTTTRYIELHGNEGSFIKMTFECGTKFMDKIVECESIIHSEDNSASIKQQIKINCNSSHGPPFNKLIFHNNMKQPIIAQLTSCRTTQGELVNDISVIIKRDGDDDNQYKATFLLSLAIERAKSLWFTVMVYIMIFVLVSAIIMINPYQVLTSMFLDVVFQSGWRDGDWRYNDLKHTFTDAMIRLCSFCVYYFFGPRFGTDNTNNNGGETTSATSSSADDDGTADTVRIKAHDLLKKANNTVSLR